MCHSLTFFTDRNNLFNTNDQFDYGGFRSLVEAMTQTTSTATLFSYQFKDPGIYVFSLSTDANKKMVNFFLVSGIYKEIFSNNIIMHYFLFHSKFCMTL